MKLLSLKSVYQKFTADEKSQINNPIFATYSLQDGDKINEIGRLLLSRLHVVVLQK